MDAVGHGVDQVAQELRGLHLAGASNETDRSELAGAIDGHEQAKLTFAGGDLRQVDVDVADRVILEALPCGLVASDLGQAIDAVPLQAAMQARPAQMREGGLQSVQAVVPWPQCVPPERDDDGLVLGREYGRPRLLQSHRRVGRGCALAPLLDRGRAHAVAPGQRPHAFLCVTGSRDGLPPSCGRFREEPGPWRVPRSTVVNRTTTPRNRTP